jgi:thiamine-monophosphate kinase
MSGDLPRAHSTPANSFAEDALLAHIRTTVAGAEHVLVGPGDDMAMIRVGNQQLLAAKDFLVEGRHFLSTASMAQIGRKAVTRNISDVAAMAAKPVAILAACVLPRSITQASAQELVDAISRTAAHFGAPLIGGDTCVHVANGPLTISVTVLAQPLEGLKPILRSGARAGDQLFVTGALGGSLAKDGGGHHFTFEPRLAESHALARLLGDDLHAMMDLSDGLARDGARFAQASALQAVIIAEQLPCTPACVQAHTHANAWRGALGDGEDYELLFAVAAGVHVPATIGPHDTPLTYIGSFQALPSTTSQSLICMHNHKVVDVSQLGHWHNA